MPIKFIGPFQGVLQLKFQKIKIFIDLNICEKQINHRENPIMIKKRHLKRKSLLVKAHYTKARQIEEQGRYPPNQNQNTQIPSVYKCF